MLHHLKVALRHLHQRGVSATVVASLSCSVANSAVGDPGPNDRPHCFDAQATESYEGITHIAIDTGPSELRVAGEPDRQLVDVTASLCDSDAMPSVKVDREGGTLHVTVRRSDAGRRFMIGPSTSLLVAITVPLETTVAIAEMIGPTSIQDVSGVDVQRGMGTLTISDIRGDVRAHKGMGAMSIARITGDLELSDGAGQMSISDVDGNVRVIADGAGQMILQTISGDVLIEQDSSGAIDAHDVGGSFTVEHKTSGRIDHRDVRGTVRIPVQKKLRSHGPR